jgi:hypothetical protein
LSATIQKQTIRTRFATFLRRVADRLDPNQTGIPVATNVAPAKVGLFGFLKKLFRRLIIWFLSLGVAFYVPIETVGFPFPLKGWEALVVKVDGFRDVFLCTVAMVVLSASDLIDNIISRRRPKGDTITVGCAWIMMVVYFLFILYGMPAFGAVAGTSDVKTPPWDILQWLLLIGVAGEFMIASMPD